MGSSRNSTLGFVTMAIAMLVRFACGHSAKMMAQPGHCMGGSFAGGTAACHDFV